MSLRGKAAIIGISELPCTRSKLGRTSFSLLAEACSKAIRDAGLRKEDIDGFITSGQTVGGPDAHTLSEYMDLELNFSEGVTTHGASGAYSIHLASMVVAAGMANYVLCTFGGTLDEDLGGSTPRSGRLRAGARPGVGGEWEMPFGPVVAMNGPYGLIKQRHMYQYGTTDRQFAQMAVNQRFNAINNPNAVFRQPITVEDVLNSRYTNEPLHLLECVMPVASGAAVVVTSAERARRGPHRPAYILGIGGPAATSDVIWQRHGDITVTPVVRSAPKAFQMAGYGPKDMQFAEMYD